MAPSAPSAPSFSESDHPRANDGKFAAKHQAEADDVSLAAADPVDALGDELRDLYDTDGEVTARLSEAGDGTGWQLDEVTVDGLTHDRSEVEQGFDFSAVEDAVQPLVDDIDFATTDTRITTEDGTATVRL